MRKIILFILTLLVGFFSATAQRDMYPKVPKMKKTEPGQVWWEPDTINRFSVYNPLNPYAREVFKYNSRGLLEEKIEQIYRDNLWKNSQLSTYTYDSNNNMLTILFQTGENNINKLLYTYTYDSNNNLQTSLSQRWTNNPDSWIYYNSNINVYDSNNNLLTDGTYTYTYDSNNNLLTKESSSDLHTYTYDSKNNRLTYLCQIWINNSLINFHLYAYTYDSNNRIITLKHYYCWTGDSLPSPTLYIYTYDSNNNLLDILSLNDSWMPINKYQWIYDENNNCISFVIMEYWDGIWQQYENDSMNTEIFLFYNNMQSAYEWHTAAKFTASYIKVSDITSKEKIKTSPPIQIHSSGKTIHINNETGENGEVSVYRIDGVKVAEQTIVNQTTTLEIPVSGFYFVSVKTGNVKPVTEKVIVR